MDIREMKAGRELDAEVAEKVMGLKVEYRTSGIDGAKYPFADFKELRHYSSEIDAAWEVAENECFTVFGLHKHSNGEWAVNWCKIEYECMNCDEECQGKYEVTAETASEAICKAALLAMEEGK